MLPGILEEQRAKSVPMNDEVRGISRRQTPLREINIAERQPERCKQRTLRVTNTIQQFEELTMEWIATCVASRTKAGPHGDSIHRERRLVPGNESLRNVWFFAKKSGLEMVTVIANYEWEDLGKGEKGVKSISFSSGANIAVPATAETEVKLFSVVAKSFIAPLNGNIGYTPCGMVGPSQNRLKDLAHATD